jgi:tetratricopeptide (TPR) repeat protein
MEKARVELSRLIDGNIALQSKDPKNAGISSQIIYEYDDLSHKLKAFDFTDTLKTQKVGQYEIILNNSPTDNNLATVINSKIYSMMDEKDYQGAISELNSYLVKYPDKKGLKMDIYYNMACSYAQLNQPKTAIKYLGLSVQEGFNDIEWIKIDPNLSGLSDDPEFKRIISGTHKL